MNLTKNIWYTSDAVKILQRHRKVWDVIKKPDATEIAATNLVLTVPKIRSGQTIGTGGTA